MCLDLSEKTINVYFYSEVEVVAIDPPNSIHLRNFPVMKVSCATVYASSYEIP